MFTTLQSQCSEFKIAHQSPKTKKRKNELLKKERNIAFEEIIDYIEKKKVLKIKHNKGKYSHQEMYLIEIREKLIYYCHV